MIKAAATHKIPRSLHSLIIASLPRLSYVGCGVDGASAGPASEALESRVHGKILLLDHNSPSSIQCYYEIVQHTGLVNHLFGFSAIIRDRAIP